MQNTRRRQDSGMILLIVAGLTVAANPDAIRQNAQKSGMESSD